MDAVTSPADRSPERPDHAAAIAVAVCVGRVAAVALVSVLAWWIVRASGLVSTFPPTPLVACLALLPVNLATVLVIRRVLHRRGARVRQLIGFERHRLGRDVGWGLLWLVVLYVPFVGTIIAVMLALHGSAAFASFGAVFAPTEYPAFPQGVAIVLGALAVITFAPVNAPVEEVTYRGYAQRALHDGGRRVLAIVVPSLIFGVQHLFFAPTWDAMLVYGLAFFVWGIGSGLIYAWQRRLAPLVVSHVLVNLASTLPALILPVVLG